MGLHTSPDDIPNARIERGMPSRIQMRHPFRPRHLERHRSHLDIPKAAGNNRVEPFQVDGHIQGEAMEGHPPPNPHTDGGKLALSPPALRFASRIDEDSRPTWNSACGDAQLVERRDQSRLETPQMTMNVASSERIEVDNRVAHQLARGVIGHVAATTHLKKLHAKLSQARFAVAQIGSIRAAAQCDDSRMFEKKKTISGPAGQPVGHGLVLKREGFRIGKLSQPFDF